MKARCRRCRKAVKWIVPHSQVCVRCTDELGKLEYDLKLLRESRVRTGQEPPPHPDQMARW